MANKLIVKNSVVAGKRPATDPTNKPGELFVNVADKVIGTFDATGNPIELGQHVTQAVTPFVTTKAYAIGDFVTQGGAIYKATAAAPAGAFDGTKWSKVAGTLTAGSVPFADTDGSLAEDNAALFWDKTNKRLGVGNKAPAQALDVTGTVKASVGGRMGGATSSNPQIHFEDTTGGKAFVGILNNEPAISAYGASTKLTVSTTGHAPIVFETAAGTPAGAEKMRISSDGKVGIGTSAPVKKLAVEGDVSILYGNAICFHNTGNAVFAADKVISCGSDGAGDLLQIQPAGGGSGTITFNTGGITNGVRAETMRLTRDRRVGIATNSPEEILHVNGPIRTGGNAATGFMQINYDTAKARGFLWHQAGVGFILVRNGQGAYEAQASGVHIWSNNAGLEKMRLDNDGKLLIGTAVAAGGELLHVNSAIRASSATITVSDARLKDNISDAPDSGDILDAIPVRSFDWKDGRGHVRWGVVAQELNEAVPEAVSVGDTWGVAKEDLVMLLIKEVQSLRARVAELEGK